MWQGDREAGWLYKGSDGNNYYQANPHTVVQKSLSVDTGFLPGLGQALKKAHTSLGFSTNDPTTAPIEKLDPHKSIQSQLPAGSQILDGIARSGQHIVPHDGHQAAGSPEQIGDQIPNGTARGTTIESINLIEDGSQVRGYVYGATDGHEYFQRTSDGARSGTVNGGIGPVSGSATEPELSGVHRYRIGDIEPGERLVPMNQQSPRLDEKLGLDPSREMKLRPGQSTAGSVLGYTSEGGIVQNAGRGPYYIHDAANFQSTPCIGDTVHVAMNANGQVAREVNPLPPGRDLGMGRG